MPAATQALAQPIVSASGTGSAALTSTDGILRGYSVRETAGSPAAASLRLRDGSVSGTILAVVALAASESKAQTLPNVRVNAGVYLERVAGSTEVVVYT